MEMHQVRYFLAVARSLNFTRAAEECNVTQPALTRAIQKLEEELGGALLHRERANTHLTELGRLMLPHLEQAFAAAQTARALADGLKRGEVSALRLGIAGTIALDVLTDILIALRRVVNGCELALGTGPQAVILERALAGDFDLVVASDSEDLPERVRRWILFQEGCRILMRGDHPLAGAAALRLADLDRQDMIARADCPLMGRFLEQCAAAGIAPAVRHSAGSEEQLQKTVLAGFGVSLVPHSTPLAAGLVGRPLEAAPLSRRVVLATIAGRRFTTAAEAFIRLARARDWTVKEIAAPAAP